MSPRTVIFMGTRRVPLEVNAAMLAAHSVGCRVALIAPSMPPVGRGILVDAEIVDIFDRPAALQAALNLASRTGADGVVSWTDAGVELAAALASRCGWPGASTESAHNARNKHSMRTALASNPELIPRFKGVRSFDDLLDAHADIGTPAVLKPAGGSGSRSILQVGEGAELQSLFEQAVTLTTPSVAPLFADYANQFIYEERLGGTEHSVEGMVHGGVVHIAGVTDKWVTDPYYVEYEQVHPSRLPARTMETIHDLTRTVVRSIGLDFTAFHLECRVLPDGSAKLLEIAARPGGGFITSHLIPLSTGIAFHANYIQIATGQAPQIERTQSLYAGSRSILSPVAGIFDGFDGLAETLSVPGVEHIAYEREKNSTIVLPPGDTLSSVLGSIVARSTSYGDLRNTLERAVEASQPRIRQPVGRST